MTSSQSSRERGNQWWEDPEAEPLRKARRARRNGRHVKTAIVAGGTAVTVAAGFGITALLPDSSAVPTAEDADYPEGFTGAEVVTDGDTEYIQLAATEDNPVLTYDEALVQPALLGLYDAAEITEAQRFIAQFVIEEAIDSELVFDTSPEAYEAWTSEHRDLFTGRALTQANVEENGTVVDSATEDITGAPRGDLVPPEDGGPAPRMDDLEVTLEMVVPDEDGNLTFVFSASYTHWVTGEKAPDGGKVPSTNRHSLSYTVVKDDDGANWLIDSWANLYMTHTDWGYVEGVVLEEGAVDPAAIAEWTKTMNGEEQADTDGETAPSE